MHGLALEQQGQARLETDALLSRQGENTRQRSLAARLVTGVEDFSEHRLLVGHEGAARMPGLAPEGAIVDHHGLGARGHPGLGAAQRLQGRFVERGLETDVLRGKSRRQRQYDVSAFPLRCLVSDNKLQSDVVAKVTQTRQRMANMHCAGRDPGSHASTSAAMPSARRRAP